MVCRQNLRSSARLRACLAGLLLGSIFGLPLRADDAREAAAADGSETQAEAETMAAAREQAPAFRFTDAEGQSHHLQQRRWRNVLKIGNGNPGTELSSDSERTNAAAGLHFEGGPVPRRTTNGSIARRPTSGDLAAPTTPSFRFSDARPPRVRGRADAELLSLTIDGVRSNSTTAENVADKVAGFSFADTEPGPTVDPAQGTSNAQSTAAHPLRAPGTVQTAGWEPTRSERSSVSKHHPLLTVEREGSASPKGEVVTIRQRTAATSEVRPASETDGTRPTASQGNPVATTSETPAARGATGTAPAASTATSAPSHQWRPKPAGIVRVSSFEPQPTQQSMQTAEFNASSASLSAPADVHSTSNVPQTAAAADTARGRSTANRADGGPGHLVDALAADSTPVWRRAPVVDLTAPAVAPETVQQPQPRAWSDSQESTGTHHDAWWANLESRTTSRQRTSDTPTAAPAGIDCRTCAEIAAGQFLLPVVLSPGTEASLIAAGDVSDAGASDPEEPTWLNPVPNGTPLLLEIETPYSGATKPSGAAAVPHTGAVYTMGPGRASHPLPAVSSAEQLRTPANRSADGHITTSSIELAALLQDLEPIAPGGPVLPGGENVTSPTATDFPATDASQTSAPGGGSGPNDAGGTMNAEQTLGEAPEETDEPLQFLRRQTVLLEPGEHQFDVGVSYLNDMSDFPVLLSDGMNLGVVRGQARQRLLSVPLELRVGIAPYTQAFVNVPFGWSNSEVSFNGSEFTEDEGGIGDVSAGVTKQIIMGNQYYPDVLASLAFSAPTGDSSITTALGTPGSSLGQGFWTLTGGLSFIQTYDPLVFFYGVGYTFRFQNEFGDNIEIEPGDQVFYRFGAGFAVNPHVTLSAAFTGSVIGRDKVDGIEIGGSVREPMSLRLAATISRRKGSKTHSSFKLIEPYVNFGLNEDSIDTLVGISWTH